MAKNKKKRNKAYTGTDAAITKPVITRISAVNRSKLGQWWFDHKKTVKPILIAAAVILGIILLIVEIVRIATGA
jgi:Ni/Fe-hydrogenase subunit HybB-like protein